MTKPKVRFQNFNDDLHEKKLGSIVDIFRGASPRPKADPKFYGGPIPRLMIEDVTRDGKYVTPKVDSLTLEGAKKSRFVTKGSLVLSCSGTRVAIPGILNVDACIHDGFFGFKNFQELDKEYLYYFFEKLHESIQSKATKGATFNNLTTEIMKTMSFVLPSQLEQKKIASFFMILDKKIKIQQEKIDMLEQFKKGMIQKIFSQEIRFKDKDGKEFPEWENKSLKHFATKIQKKNLDSKITNVISNSAKRGLVSQRSYFKKEIANELNINGYYVISNEDFVYNPRISSESPYGPIHMYTAKDEGIVSPLYLCFKAKNINSIFLKYFFISSLWHKHIYNHGDSGARHDRVSIKDSYFFEMIIPIPNLNEQEKISEFLYKIDEKIIFEKERLDNLMEMKNGFMQQMFI